MTDAPSEIDLPAAVAAVIGVEQYETDAGFDAEMGYVWTSLRCV